MVNNAFRSLKSLVTIVKFNIEDFYFKYETRNQIDLNLVKKLDPLNHS